jgi:hypothetical protein
MANDIVIITYAARAPRPSELSGFKPGTLLLNKHPLSGSDQGIGSQWVVKDISKDGNMTFYPVDSRSLNSERSRPLTGLVPYAANGLHTTKSYFEPLPAHTNAIL